MRWGILISVAACCIFLPVRAQAMNVLPSSADVVLMPGEQTSLVFTVENTSVVSREYSVSLYDVAFDAETGEPTFGPLSREHASWLQFAAYDFTLAPLSERVLALTMTIPDSATADTVVIAPVVRESADDNALTLSTGMSSLVFLTVGNPETHAGIVDFHAQPGIGSHLPIALTAVIANNGERIVQPYGIVRITDVFGGVVASLDFNHDFRRVPSSLTRDFSVQWGEDTTVTGFGQELWHELTAGIGLFTAELVAAPYPGAQPTLYATTRIVIFPWRIASLVCGIGMIILVSIVRKRRRF